MRAPIWNITVAAGMLLAASAFAQAHDGHHPGAPPKPRAPGAASHEGIDHSPKAQVLEISVTSEGFVPSEARVKLGQPVKLLVTRRTARTCATDIVIKDFGVDTPLPLGVPVEVTFTPTRVGRVRYACAMDMLAGVLVVE